MATGTPNYAITPAVNCGVVTTGDTSRTAPTNKATVFTAGASGSRIERLAICAIGTTVASLLRIFLYNGTTYFLYYETPVPAVTPSVSAGITAWNTTLEAVTTPNLFPLVLPTTWSVVASVNDTQTSSGINVTAIGGNF